MYTLCEIQYVDEELPMSVWIKATEEVDENDDKIFFYGINRAELISYAESREIREGEWRVLKVYETVDSI